MQQVTRELNLSETVFVLPPDDARHTPAAADLHAGWRSSPSPAIRRWERLFILAATGEVPLAGRGDAHRFRGRGGARASADPGEKGAGRSLRSSRRRSSRRSVRRRLRSRNGRRCSPSNPRTCWTGMAPRRPSPAACPSSTSRCATVAPWGAPGCGSTVGRRCSRSSGLPMCTSSPAIPELPGSRPALAHVRAAHRDRRRPCDRRRHRLLRRLSRHPRPGARRHPALGRRAGLRNGPANLLHLEVDKQEGEITAVRVGGSSVLMSEGWMEVPEEGIGAPEA